MNHEAIEIPAGAVIAYQEIAQDLEKESYTQAIPINSVSRVPNTQSQSSDEIQYPQVDKLKSSNQQVLEKHFDLTSAKQL